MSGSQRRIPRAFATGSLLISPVLWLGRGSRFAGIRVEDLSNPMTMVSFHRVWLEAVHMPLNFVLLTYALASHAERLLNKD
jgi:hypothetical protein